MRLLRRSSAFSRISNDELAPSKTVACPARSLVKSMPAVKAARTVDTVCPHEPTLAASDRVVVQMDDGRLFDSGEIEEARGGIAHPLIAGELEAKFMDCVAGNGHDAARLACTVSCNGSRPSTE